MHFYKYAAFMAAERESVKEDAALEDLADVYIEHGLAYGNCALYGVSKERI